MRRLRREEGMALLTTLIVVTVMMSLAVGVTSVVNTQTGQTRTERSSESAFNLAEAALNAQAFLLGRNWPRSTAQMPSPSTAASPCSGQTMSGTLATPSSTTSMRDQIQSLLAQTYNGDTASRWWVTACEEGGRSSWDASLLNGLAYDPSVTASPAAKPRRMWIRAEAEVAGHRRAVVGLVQAGQQTAYPPLAVVTGMMGSDVGSTLTGLLAGDLLNAALGLVLDTDPMFVGKVGLRCNALATAQLLDCLSGLLKTVSALGPLGDLLTSNDYVGFEADSVLSADQVTQLRQQAQATSTYYGTTSAGAGTVNSGAACLPAGAAGKIIFIEKVGNGTGSCVLNTAGNPSAAALIVGAGGVRVTGGGTFTGIIHTLRRDALASDAPDVLIENDSHVVGGVFADDNPALGSKAHGQVYVDPGEVNLQDAIPLCGIPIVNLVCATLNGLLGAIGVSDLLGALVPGLGPAFPGVTYNANVVNSVATFNDSALVTGTFRQVPPS